MTRIVIADDDKDTVDLVVYWLSRLGLDVDAYYDGAHALESILHGPPDLAIIDLDMPAKNGLEVVKAIRDHGLELPLIVYTGAAWKREPSFEAGANHYIVKPFSITALGAYVKQILGLP